MICTGMLSYVITDRLVVRLLLSVGGAPQKRYLLCGELESTSVSGLRSF